MAARLMHQTKLVLLLSLNAVAILIVGVMIFSAINLNGGIELKVIGEDSDEVAGVLEELGLLAPASDSLAAPVVESGGAASGGSGGGGYVSTGRSTASSGGVGQRISVAGVGGGGCVHVLSGGVFGYLGGGRIDGAGGYVLANFESGGDCRVL